MLSIPVPFPEINRKIKRKERKKEEIGIRNLLSEKGSLVVVWMGSINTFCAGSSAIDIGNLWLLYRKFEFVSGGSLVMLKVKEIHLCRLYYLLLVYV
ncbi:hypothetical protein CEXT_157651 [Caerostris extrusa]|uniref:Uncharacterized protein n=1 Tax=Caerostris extrusa TaxID=172846 RepID=A0AAV4QSG5_CAEEX|nr:hypothetical protein CEXT_157651 [Caerostris extrusa]